MTLYIFTNGTDADADEVNSNISFLTKLQLETLANNVSSSNSQELVSSALKIVDKFLDSSGENNTVDTGNTDALYDTGNNYYRCVGTDITSSTISDAGFESTSNWTYYESRSTFEGAQSTDHHTEGSYSYRLYGAYYSGGYGSGDYCQIKQSVDFTNIDYLKIDITYFDSEGGDDEWRIYAGSTLLASGSSNSNDYFIDCSAVTGTKDLTIRLYVSSNGSNFAGPLYVDNIRAYSSTYIDSKVQSDTVTILTSVDKIILTPLMYEELSSGDTLTFDYSMDNESTWNTGNAVNTWIDASGATNTGTLSVRLQFDTHDGSTTPKVKGWAVAVSE